jgi:hypothetical protein
MSALLGTPIFLAGELGLSNLASIKGRRSIGKDDRAFILYKIAKEWFRL